MSEYRLVSSDHKLVPPCNVVDIKNNIHLYVADETSFKKTTELADISEKALVITIGAVTLFCCIFSLNFGSSGWTLGNLVTFLLVVFCGYTTVVTARTWSDSNLEIRRIHESGVPCTYIPDESNDKIVYCSTGSGL